MKFNVGQDVTYTGSESHFTTGKIYPIVQVDDDDANMPIQLENERGEWRWIYASEFDVVADTAELVELRAWKASALARFPALAKDETDDEAVERLCKQYDLRDYGDTFNAIRDAITWARANPR